MAAARWSCGPATNQFGVATVTVKVTDGDGGETTTTFGLKVNSINDLPAISTVGDQVILEDTSTAAIPFTVGDVETAAEALEVTATSSNPGVVLNAGLVLSGAGTNRTITVTPAANQFGSALITLRVTDADNAEATTVFQVTVVPVNDPPTLDGIATVNLNEDAGLHTVNLTGLSTGAANEIQTLEVTAENDNPALLTDLAVTHTPPNGSGTLSFRTVTNAYGNATVTVRVNDGGSSNNLVQQTFTVEVQSVNDLPTITALNHQLTDEDVPTGILAFTVDDVETAAGRLVVTGSSSNPALVPVGGLEFGGSGGSRTLVVQPGDKPVRRGNAHRESDRRRRRRNHHNLWAHSEQHQRSARDHRTACASHG